MKIYRADVGTSLSYITKFKNSKNEFKQTYQRVDVKTHNFTKERIKELLGIPSTDVLVVED